MSIRDVKVAARQALHDFMGVPAAFYPTPGSTPVLRTIRPHYGPINNGDLAGTNLSYVETHEQQQTIVCWIAEYDDYEADLVQGALFVISETEGYFIDTQRPRDGQTVKCESYPADAADLAGKTLPGDL